MITVYVWLPKRVANQKNVGHASLQVDDRAYVSWWPSVPAGISGDFAPIRNKSFASDMRDEGCRADWTVRLRGLDEQAILSWWSSFGLVRDGHLLLGPLQSYSLIHRNCSTVVATALKLAGGDRYSSWANTWAIVWRPQAVLDYARSIETGLRGKSTGR